MQDYERIIHEKGANPTDLLDKFSTLSGVSVEQVSQYAGQWYPITKTFGLSSVSYLGVLVEQLSGTNKGDLSVLEEILQRAATVAVDDLGLFRGSNKKINRGIIHYRLFEKMCKKLGDVTNHELIPETKEVCRQIEELFKTQSGGLAAYRVVEGIAYSIVEHQLPFFLAAEKNGTKVYSEKELTYITLHLAIEKEHAQESVKLINMYLDIGGNEKIITKQISGFAEAFGHYWKAMARLVVSPQTITE